MRRTSFIVIAFVVILSLVLSACAPEATPTQAAQSEPTAAVPMTEPTAAEQPAEAVEPTTAAEEIPNTANEGAMVELPEVNPADVTGDVITAGSSTVYPLSEAMVNLFKEEGYTGSITVDSIGSGAGLERFCVSGETDIANASRAIKDSEVESCQAIGRDPIEFRVGTDALAIVVNPQNDFLTDITLEELAKVYSAGVTTWADVNPAWPAEPIKRYAPGTDSGTYDFFIEFVMQPAYEKDADKAAEAFQGANPQQSEDDNVLVQGVEGDQYAIGFFGYAYYQENADRLKIISIDGVEPTFDSAESGEYPLARPLYIYSSASILNEKPQVAAFINFYLTRVNDLIEEVGYFPASEEALDQARQSLLDAME